MIWLHMPIEITRYYNATLDIHYIIPDAISQWKK